MVGTADIYKNFYNVIRTNLTTPAEIIPENVDDVPTFPHIVLHLPLLPRNIDTFEKYSRNGSIDVDVIAEDIQTLSELYDEVENLIFANKGDLIVQNLSSGSSTKATIELGGKEVYILTLPLEFMFKR